ncbi:hypothetical protein HYV82_01405 [Candidatus Woesearchaeota archaeon]|nr:hypothetical protein [Candidatus Woesearchaeota archaeon]
MVQDRKTIPQPEVEAAFAGNAAHTAFIRSLRGLYEVLRLNPAGLRWADVTTDPLSQYSPRAIFVSAGTDLSSLGVEAVAMDGDKTVSRPYYVPILLRDVRPLSLAGIGKYEIKRLRGVEKEQDELLQEPFSLEALIGSYVEQGYKLPGTTPVVEAVVFLPMSSDGEFKTEFNPVARAGSSGDYAFRYIVQESFGKLGMHVPSGATVRIYDYKGGKHYGFDATYFPNMTALRRLMEPDTASRMILIALPIMRVNRGIDPADMQSLIEQINRGSNMVSQKGGSASGNQEPGTEPSHSPYQAPATQSKRPMLTSPDEFRRPLEPHLYMAGADFETGQNTRGGGSGFYSLGFGPTTPKAPARSGEAARVSINRGSERGTTGSTFTPKPDPERIGIIYSLSFVGVKPDSLPDNPVLEGLARSLYHRN